MKSFLYASFDPRPVAVEANEAILASGPVLGIEVTIAALAARCVANIDPQHSGGNADLAAIEAALDVEIPEGVVTLATVRADLDALGAMVLLSKRAAGEELSDELLNRVRKVAEADKFLKGAWHPADLPTWDNPWPARDGGLAGIGAAVMDFKVPLAERVATMATWLETGEEPVKYREQVERERADLIQALEEGSIKWGISERVVTVISSHRAATMIGYSIGPVVVAMNPEFRLGGSQPYKKFTICQYQNGLVDMKAALAELAELEPGWGGSPTIGGSPQGVSSTLTLEQVVEVVKKHLK